MDQSPLGPQTSSVKRLLMLGAVLLGWSLILFLRLFQLTVVAHGPLARRADAQQETRKAIDAPRGTIFDRNGNPLAISSPSEFVVADPKRIPNKEIAAALLAKILGLDGKKLQKDLESAGASKHRAGYFVVDPNVSKDKAAALEAMKLDWIEIRQGNLRSYPNGRLGAHVVGNVDAEGKGVSGVELKCNRELSGTAGWARLQVDVKRRAYESEVVQSPVVGKNIGLTIDSQLQYLAEEALATAVPANHADHGSLVAMNPKTGEVLALANFPNYDLNERLHAGDKPHGRENLAVVAPFEPGSVFKVVTLSSALETTNLRPDTIINCGNGSITIFGRVVHDSHSYSALSFADVLAKSSNIGAIRIGMQVGSRNLYTYIRKFGFGQRTGIELPAEAPGLVRPLRRWQPTSIGSVPMGHEVSVTSLQLAQLGSVIANGGFLVHPHVIAWKQAPGGERELVRPSTPERVLNPETVVTMRMLMHRVVMPGGTARRLHIAGYALAGKTGTAQIYDYAHHIYTHRYNASFLGFAPLENPALVVVVTISGTTGEAGFGGAAAGPVFQSVMTAALRVLSVPPDVPEELITEEAKAEQDSDASEEPDDVSIASLSTPPTADEMQAASGAPPVPQLLGKTVKDVIEVASENGLEVDLLGEGIARAQQPAAGAALIPGEHIRVRFAAASARGHE